MGLLTPQQLASETEHPESERMTQDNQAELHGLF